MDVTGSLEAVLVHPERAWAQIEADSDVPESRADDPAGDDHDEKGDDPDHREDPDQLPLTRFYGQVELDPVRAIRDLEGILTEVVAHLRRSGKDVTISVEVNAEAEGFDPHTIRVVSENAAQLGFSSHEFES